MRNGSWSNPIFVGRTQNLHKSTVAHIQSGSIDYVVSNGISPLIGDTMGCCVIQKSFQLFTIPIVFTIFSRYASAAHFEWYSRRVNSKHVCEKEMPVTSHKWRSIEQPSMQSKQVLSQSQFYGNRTLFCNTIHTTFCICLNLIVSITATSHFFVFFVNLACKSGRFFLFLFRYVSTTQWLAWLVAL